MMNNEGLKLESFEDKKVENNQESLLLVKIRKMEENMAELIVENEKLKKDLMHDALTGLNARKYLEERLEETITSLKNPENEKRKDGFKNFSLIFCDIDNFKKINDELGHKGGDETLKKVSAIINHNVRVSDVVCCWGGDEIAIGLFEVEEGEAVKIAEKIRLAVEREAKDTGVTLSMGVVPYEEGLDTASITDRADKAMYFAKSNKKNNVKTYAEIPKDKAK